MVQVQAQAPVQHRVAQLVPAQVQAVVQVLLLVPVQEQVVQEQVQAPERELVPIQPVTTVAPAINGF
jgi:hypothetical protein